MRDFFFSAVLVFKEASNFLTWSNFTWHFLFCFRKFHHLWSIMILDILYRFQQRKKSPEGGATAVCHVASHICNIIHLVSVKSHTDRSTFAALYVGQCAQTTWNSRQRMTAAAAVTAASLCCLWWFSVFVVNPFSIDFIFKPVNSQPPFVNKHSK